LPLQADYKVRSLSFCYSSLYAVEFRGEDKFIRCDEHQLLCLLSTSKEAWEDYIS